MIQKIISTITDVGLLLIVCIWMILFIIVAEIACLISPAWKEDIRRTFGGDPYDE